MFRTPLVTEPRRQSSTVYRITLDRNLWKVMRSHSSIPHAFFSLNDAEAFVRNDSKGAAEVIELLVGSTYIVKRLD